MSRLLSQAGEALYGSHWQTDMAKALSVSDRTMRRWVAGVDDMPPGVSMDLWRLCEERTLVLDELVERLKIAATP